MEGKFFKFCALAAVMFFAVPAAAATPAAVANLRQIYASRPDLQRLFDPTDWSGTPEATLLGFTSLEHWAAQAGSAEYPDQLGAYKSALNTPNALAPQASALKPVKKPGAVFDPASVTASEIFAVDVDSRQELLGLHDRLVWPIASITKLMTATVIVDRNTSLAKKMKLQRSDEVGGARLRVAVGTVIPLRDFMYAMLVGSANNAANAVARSSGLSRAQFVAAMNAKAKALGLASTRFVDPSGMNPRNVSTAREVAALAIEAFGRPLIGQIASTAQYDITLARSVHHIKNTNELLIDENNGLNVSGGKTGYLPQSGWNLVTKIEDSHKHQIVVVVLGTSSQAQSSKDAETVARWVWDNYEWK